MSTRRLADAFTRSRFAKVHAPRPLPGRVGAMALCGVVLLCASLVSVSLEAQDRVVPPESFSVTPAVEPADDVTTARTPVNRPTYQTLRFEEDWSVLRGYSDTDLDDPFDPIKFIPIAADGDVWLSLGGQYRVRGEAWSNFNFNVPGKSDDTFLLNRFLYHADLHIYDYVRVFAEGKSAFAWSRELAGRRRTSDVDELDLLNGFVDLMIPLGEDAKLTIRPGRQELLFGSQRLVSPLDWSNVRRTFDGFSAIFETGGWNVHGFWMQTVPVQKYDFNSADRQSQFYGVYATAKDEILPGTVDLYALGLDTDVAATRGYNGTTGDERRFTLGTRVAGLVGDSDFDYEFEGAYQFGTLGAGDIQAFMLSAELGYTIADAVEKPRFAVGFDYASGDDAPGGDVETFNQLFPLGHSWLGWADVIARENFAAARLSFRTEPLEALTFTADAHYFLRASSRDGVYDAGGNLLRADGLGGNSGDIGFEIDLSLIYRFSRHLGGQLGYVHFFAGDFIQDSGAGSNSDIDFAFLALTFTF